MNEGRRFPAGPLVAALGGVLLLVSLFLDWFDDFTAWTIFEVLDLVLAAIALATLATLVREIGVPLPRVRVMTAGALLPLALTGFVVVVSQLVNHPPAAVDRDPDVGAWLALAATAIMLAGAVLAAARISLAVDVGPSESEAPTVQQPPGPPGPPGPSP